jgi:integrative and conjugative element protein (TIGR02256 family)
MEQEAGRRAPDESGGILLGYPGRDDPGIVSVLFEIGPGPNAMHKPYRFEPDGPWQEREIAAAYERSDRIATYLGDWHSHPDGSPRPSGLDRATARKIARTPEARCPHPLIVILADGKRKWDVAAHCFGWWRLRSVDLEVVP